MTSAVRHPPAPRVASAGGRATGVAAAVVLATTTAEGGGPSAAQRFQGTSLLSRLLDQLTGLALPAVHVVTRPGFEAVLRPIADAAGAELHVAPDAGADLRRVATVAGAVSGGVVVLQGDLITQREALAGLLADPRIATGALVTGGKSGRPFAFKLRARRGRIVSAGSAYHNVHRPNSAFLGVIKVDAADRDTLVEIADRLAVPAAAPPAEWRAELELKRGTWRLAWHRVLERRAARVAAGLDEEGEDDERDERDAVRSMELDLAGDAGSDAEHEGDGADHRGPDDVELDPEGAAELERRVAAAGEDVVALLLVGLVRSDVVVRISNLRRLYWSRPLSAAAVERSTERIDAFDEDKALRTSAVKASDGFFTTYFVSPYSQYIARWCAKRGFTPNQITVVSLFVGLLAALAFATGERWGLITGAVLLQAAFTLDCVDGQTARYTRTFSKLGAWLDSVFDRSKEYLVFAGLAAGAAAQGDPVWHLACAALALQTARHAIDFSYPAIKQTADAAMDFPPLEQPWDGFGSGLPYWARTPKERAAADAQAARPAADAPAGAVLRAKRFWRRAGKNRRVVWAKKIMMFPIGERFAAISLAAALFDARIVFYVLLVWGGWASTYVVLGRALRSLRTAGSSAAVPESEGAQRLRAYRDDGPIGTAIARVLGPLLPLPGWLLTLVGVLPVFATALIAGADASRPLALVVCAWFVVLAGAASARGETDALRWLVPPLLRAGEFAAIAWVSARADADADPATFALLCAIAFHHYDVVYRLRQRGEVPPRWLTAVGGGWEGRLIVVVALLALLPTDVSPAAIWILAAGLGVMYVTEAVRGWIAYGRRAGTVYDEEDEG